MGPKRSKAIVVDVESLVLEIDVESLLREVAKERPVNLDVQLDDLIRQAEKFTKNHPDAPQELGKAVKLFGRIAKSLKVYRQKKDIDGVQVLSMGLGKLGQLIEAMPVFEAIQAKGISMRQQRKSLRLGPFSSYGSKEARERIVAEWKREYDQFDANWSNRRKCREIAKTTQHHNLSKRDAGGQPKRFSWQAISNAIRDSARDK